FGFEHELLVGRVIRGVKESCVETNGRLPEQPPPPNLAAMRPMLTHAEGAVEPPGPEPTVTTPSTPSSTSNPWRILIEAASCRRSGDIFIFPIASASSYFSTKGGLFFIASILRGLGRPFACL
ncbi:hypothetical protein THAOC_21797, partial [Thalassiosira oceanica]